MNITVKLTRSNKTEHLDLKEGATVEDALRKINFKPDTVIALKKNKPIPIDDKLNEGDKITILQVSSGG